MEPREEAERKAREAEVRAVSELMGELDDATALWLATEMALSEAKRAHQSAELRWRRAHQAIRAKLLKK